MNYKKTWDITGQHSISARCKLTATLAQRCITSETAKKTEERGGGGGEEEEETEAEEQEEEEQQQQQQRQHPKSTKKGSINANQKQVSINFKKQLSQAWKKQSSTQ